MACGCQNYFTKAEAVQKPTKKHKTKELKAGEQTQKLVYYPASNDKTTQEAVEAPAEKINKRLWDLYKNGLAFPEIDEVSLFKNKNYQVSVPIGLRSSRMSPIQCVFDTGTGTNLIRADVLDPIWLNSIRQRDMPDIRSASDTKFKVSGTITLLIRKGKSRTRVNFNAVNELVVPLLLRTTFIDSFRKSIHPAERKIVP